MKHKSLINKLKKIKANVAEHRAGYEFSVVMNGRELHWYKQGESVVGLRSRDIDDVDDSYTDYHAGFFPRTIKCAIETLYWNVSSRQKVEQKMDKLIEEILHEP